MPRRFGYIQQRGFSLAKNCIEGKIISGCCQIFVGVEKFSSTLDEYIGKKSQYEL